ncbi:MAG: MATE family efflux transporter [Polyangiaceae bacterium]|nr:MATE family efflux transporter [Polyangiaceae bacterium]
MNSTVTSEIRETLRLALPITFAQVALMTMGLVDAALVGRVSATELAAVSMGNSMAFAMICPAMGVTMAVEPLASQAVGAGEPMRAWTSFRAGVLACLWLSVPTMALVAGSALVLGPAGVDGAVVPSAQRFIWARLPGVPMWLLFMAAKAYLEARGVTRPLYLWGWIANVLNFLICAVLVFGDGALKRIGLPALGLPALGSLGAGLATSFSNTVLAAAALGAAWGCRPEGATLLGEREELREMSRKLLRVGVPIGFQILTEVGVFSAVSVLVGRLGAVPTAAHQIALGLASFTFMGVLGMSGATSVRVGRAIGAGEAGGPRRAGIVGVGLGAAYMACCGVVFLLAPGPLARLFSEDPAVLAVAENLIRVAAAFQIFDGIQGVSSGALRGAADTRFASWVNVLCHWGVGLPMAVLFGLVGGRGVVGLWWGLCVGLLVVSAALLWRFWRISSRAIAAA